jgi:hypothetical protein
MTPLGVQLLVRCPALDVNTDQLVRRTTTGFDHQVGSDDIFWRQLPDKHDRVEQLVVRWRLSVRRQRRRVLLTATDEGRELRVGGKRCHRLPADESKQLQTRLFDQHGIDITVELDDQHILRADSQDRESMSVALTDFEDLVVYLLTVRHVVGSFGATPTAARDLSAR